MNILFVNPYASSKGLKTESCGCGAEESLFLLVKNLDKSRYHPIVVYPAKSSLKRYDSEERYRQLGIKLLFIPLPVLKRHYSFKELFRYSLMIIPSIIKLCKIIKEDKIELVHSNSTQTFTSAIASKICGIPHIFHVRQLVKKPLWMKNLLVKYLDFTSTKLFCVSNPVANMFLDKGVKKNKISIIFNKVNLERYPKSEAEMLINAQKIRTEFNIPEESGIVGIVGRLDPRKGHVYFLHAAKEVLAKYTKTKFMIIGDIDIDNFKQYKDKLKHIINELNLTSSIIWTGFRDDIPVLVSSLDCLVMPSCSDKSPEPFGRVLIEAMACYKPVIATNSGGAVDIIADNETGYLIPSADYLAISRAVIDLLTKKDKAKQMGLKGRRRVEQLFSLKKDEDLFSSLKFQS